MPATDDFSAYKTGLDTPAEHAAVVAPSDGVDLASTSRALWIGGAGDITVIMKGSEAVQFVAVPAGTLLPFRVSRVKATGTSATSIVAVW